VLMDDRRKKALRKRLCALESPKSWIRASSRAGCWLAAVAPADGNLTRALLAGSVSMRSARFATEIVCRAEGHSIFSFLLAAGRFIRMDWLWFGPMCSDVVESFEA